MVEDSGIVNRLYGDLFMTQQAALVQWLGETRDLPFRSTPGPETPRFARADSQLLKPGRFTHLGYMSFCTTPAATAPLAPGGDDLKMSFFR